MTGAKQRVAIIGARGIGRHHARWWHLSGAEVCAHLGTSEASVADAAERMRKLFPYEGKGYTSLESLLAEARPDWIDVSSPEPMHANHVRVCLEAGIDVLCEKPFYYAPGLSRHEMVKVTDELVDLAEQRQLQLGLCSQYSVAAESCIALFHGERPGQAITSFVGELASPVHGREPNPLQTWMDLAPHLVASAQVIAATHGADSPTIDPGSIVREFDGYHARCSFNLVHDGEVLLACTFHAWHTQGEEPGNIRRLTLNGMAFDLLGENDSQGIYRSRIDYPGGQHRSPDAMHELIQRTLQGKTPLSGHQIRTNEAWLMELAGL